MKLTNTWKHALVGAVFGLLWFLICQIPGMHQLAVFGMFAFFFGTMAWEQAQKMRARHWNWLDSLADVVCGNAGFHAAYWLLVLILKERLWNML
ncbi:MAG: hypothetical protein LHW53_04090 [Candidatus Cloacimonetes bacterium]|nr:hypothetical protein [Candidatus Cloacimonadota bacterium]